MAPDIMGTIILVITLLLFVTQWIPPTATAILSIALFALTGAASYETCISGFSNNIIIMLFGVLIVGQAMLESGLATMIGRACLKLSRGHESRFLLYMMICLFLFTDLPLGLTANVAALLCILFRLVSLKTALPRLDWDIIIRLACTLGLAAALQECGFCELISGAFISVFGSGISPWAIMVFTLIVSTVMSQFMGNSTVVLVLGAAILPIVTGLGYDPLAVTMALTMGSSFAWMTPIAGACIGITYSSGYRFTDYARYTGLLTVLMWAVAVIWLPLAFPF